VGILDFFSREAGQARRKALEDALSYYIPPELAGPLGLLSEVSPVTSMERAGEASGRMMDPNLPGMARIGATGEMLSNVAGVVAPAMVAGRAGMPAANAIQEGLLGMSNSPAGMAAGNMIGDEFGGLRLYHGSPHDFDRFSMDKIGTGEGKQNYGKGLYFAENEAVAQKYRDYLASRVPLYQGDDAFRFSDDGSPTEAGILQVASRIQRYGESPSQALQRASEHWSERAYTGPGTAPSFDGISLSDFSTPPGRLYEVEVNADPGDFLNWNAPFTSQPEQVKNVFGARFEGGKPTARFKKVLGEDLWWGRRLEEEKALRKSIPGIRYLDEGSGGAGDGSRNYVVFDENLINIVQKYGIAGAAVMLGVSQADVAQAMEQQQRPPQRGLLEMPQ
jgi:hypothetical protein